MSTDENIKTILTEQVSGYRTLLDILQRERECLLHFNAPEVETLSKEKDTVVLKLKLLEEERIRLVKSFVAEHDVDEQAAFQTLSRVTGDHSFQRLRMQLISLLQSITELNGFNRVLIERSVTVVKNALNFLGSIGVTVQSSKSGSRLTREV
ncbi:MAG TPA: flagellar protein FlgN [Nitrospirota bacterium]|nr:flagellar protein FlgN [Nitrospirota bacterium]